MRVNNRIVIHVNDARVRADLMRHLAHVAAGGQPRPDIEKLRNTRLKNQVMHHTVQELPIGDGAERGHRCEAKDLGKESAIGGEVILAAEHGVVYPCDIRPGEVEVREFCVTERIACCH